MPSTSITKFLKNRELLVYSPIYFFLSITNLVLKLRLTEDWLNGTLGRNHLALMAFHYFNNEQARLLQFLIPEFFRRFFSMSIVTAYAVQRFLFIFLAFLAFHFFLRKWFSSMVSFAGVLILAGSLVVSFLVTDLQESAPLLLLLFVLGLWAIREERDFLFGFFLFLGGGLTNESMLVLPLGYFLYRLPSRQPRDILKTGLRTALLALPAFIAQGTLRYINRNLPYFGGGFHLPDNLFGIWNELQHPLEAFFYGSYFFPFLIFSIFWVYAFFGYSKSPRFFRCVFWITPFFVGANLITGIIKESRQMLPLAFILIPMALFFVSSKMKVTVEPSHEFEVETIGGLFAQGPKPGQVRQ